ncbi:sugar transporter [Celerinatantimonas yamalensis]|uniref:Sugar transporter n=1 Tax=Celerinatantimonas yamalensis TaxID=559956 RepID=A0ABW9G650_9GAMM
MQHKHLEWSVWFPVMSLAVAAFIFSTSEFMPVGLLSNIGQTFHYSPAHTGLIITIYAWTVSLTSLPCMLLTGHMERRQLLIWVFVGFILSHILSAVAWSFWILVISRIGVAVTHAIFWAITASLAMRVAPQGHTTKALTMLVLGTSLATILGLPLGRMLSQAINWRWAFLSIGVLASIGLLLIKQYLPPLASKNKAVFHTLPTLLKRPALMSLYALTLLLTTAHFCAYGYIEPFIVYIAHGSANFATAILFIFGIAGILASSLFSPLNRYPFALLAGSIALLALSTYLLLPLATTRGPLLTLILLWGLAITWIGLCLQIRILKLADDAADLATSIFSTVYNIGVGAGALIGQQMIMKLGLAHIGESAALLALLGLVCYYFVNGYSSMHSPLAHHKIH